MLPRRPPPLPSPGVPGEGIGARASTSACDCSRDIIAAMPERVICDICGHTVPPHAHYIVKIEVYADPSLPALDSNDLEEKDSEKELAALMAELKHYTADELQDQVHRRFEYRLCRACQRAFIANPLG